MKKFNLEKALAGKPVVTKAGEPVTGLVDFNVMGQTLAGVLGGFVELWDRGGKYGINSEKIDLVMVTEVKTGWVNVYEGDPAVIGNLHETEEVARQYARDHKDCIDTVKITWEE